MAIDKIKSESLDLTDDYTFTGKVDGSVSPYFCVSLNGQVTGQADATWTKIAFNNFDTNVGSDYDTTNNKFVVSIPGKYYFNCHLTAGTSSASSVGTCSTKLYKNGSAISKSENTQKMENECELTTMNSQFVLDLVADDYIEAYGFIDRSTGTTRFTRSQFVGFRLGN